MDKGNILMNYIQQELARGRATKVGAGDDLLSAGIIDSLGILQLVAFIEEQFQVQVPDEDVIYDNFYSVQAMVNYLSAT